MIRKEKAPSPAKVQRPFQIVQSDYTAPIHQCQSCGTCLQCEAWFAIYQLHQAIKEIRLKGRL